MIGAPKSGFRGSAAAEVITLEAQKVGFQVADLQLRFPMEMPGTRSIGSGKWRLIEDWPFQLNERAFVVPMGFVTDLYSVPWGLNLLFPRDERDNRPGVIHDWFYATGGLRATDTDEGLPRTIGDRMLLITCLQCSFRVSRANAIHAGVRIGGWLPFNRLAKAGHSISNPMMD